MQYKTAINRPKCSGQQQDLQLERVGFGYSNRFLLKVPLRKLGLFGGLKTKQNNEWNN